MVKKLVFWVNGSDDKMPWFSDSEITGLKIKAKHASSSEPLALNMMFPTCVLPLWAICSIKTKDRLQFEDGLRY